MARENVLEGERRKVLRELNSRIWSYLRWDMDKSDSDDLDESLLEFIDLCLTGQGEFSIFQREEQAPNKTPRPE